MKTELSYNQKPQL